MPNHDPQLKPEGDYNAIRQSVADVFADGPPSPAHFVRVIRVAELGILEQLEERGVSEAATLTADLERAVKIDDMASLPAGVASRYDNDQPGINQELNQRARDKREHLFSLALATGELAGIIVGSVTRPDSLRGPLGDGKRAIDMYAEATPASTGAVLLRGLLGQADEAARQASPEESASS